MSILKLEYEILVSGIYPFEGTFEKCCFKIVKNTIDEKVLNKNLKEGIIYLNPLIGMCCYPDSTGTPVYLTFQKEEFIEIDYANEEEYDVEFTVGHLESLHVFDVVESLEKAMVLEVNNDIKFPVKMVKAYDGEGNYVTFLADFIKLNVPSLLSNDQTQTIEVMKRQENRLNSEISYESITKLANKNKYFKNALTMYHASFSVSDHNVGFTLLVIALESLLGLSTYAKVEKCDECGQQKFLITSTISQNVSLILMDQDDTIKKRIKKLYSVRSKFVHNGIEIAKQDEQEMQEYVRKVLLMYWFISMYKTTCDHKIIISEIRSAEYKENLIYQNFLIGLDNTSFEEKRTTMLKDTLLRIFRKE